MNKLLVVSGAALLITSASPATAETQRWPNWYIGVSGGVAFLQSSDINGGGKASFNDGGMGTLSVGYVLPSTVQPFSNMRFEVEFGYHYNPLDSGVVSGSPVTVSGNLRSFSYMGNAYYDFRNTSALTPYVGAGLGGARVSLSKNSGLGNVNDTSNVMAYQFMGGVSYAPKMLPLTEWSLGYRCFIEGSPEFASATGKVKLDSLKSHNIEVGGRFRF